VKSSDASHAGYTGISLERRDNGPGLIKNVSVDGFQYGVRLVDFPYAITMENISVSNQSAAGVYVYDMPVSIRNLTSVNTAPALTVDNLSLVDLIGANCTGGSAANVAIDNINSNSHIYARNVTSSGYAAAIRNRGTIATGAAVTEYVSDGINNLGPTRLSSLNLPIQETPTYFDTDLTHWKSVTSSGAVPNDGADDTAAIQAALNSGSSVIYFPTGEYEIGNTLHIPATVKHLVGLEARLETSPSSMFTDGRPVFRFEGTGSDAVLMEGFHNEVGGNNVGVEIATSRTVALKDMQVGNGPGVRNTANCGSLFLEDVVSGLHLDYPENVWARQYNAEGQDPRTINNGGSLWILGYKAERSDTLFETHAGGRTEVLGGNVYATGDAGTGVPAILNDDSSVSVSLAGTAFNNGFFFDNWVHEIRNGVARDLPVSAASWRGLGGTISLYAGDAEVALNAGGGAAGIFVDENSQIPVGSTGTFFTSDPIDVSGVVNPAPQSVYQSERDDLGGGFSYTFTGFPAGQPVTVRLHFVERYFTTAGSRKANVTINGSTVLSNFDIIAATGAKNKAIVKDIVGTADANGKIAIAFSSVADRALINGIEIINAATGTGTGLKGDYFGTQSVSGIIVKGRTDSTVNFDWGAGSPDPTVPVDHFSARWTGQVQATVAGNYTFSTTSDDGVRLWVNGVQVINDWTDHPPTTDTSGTVTLAAGQKVDIKMEYYENGGGAVAKLLWTPPGATAAATIPQTQLYPAAAVSALISQGKTATASSVENNNWLAAYAVDGNGGTRWSSLYSDPQWITVDLGSVKTVTEAKLNWEVAAGRDYKIQISSDNSTWSDLKTVTGNTTTGVIDYAGLAGSGRYVRMYGTARATGYGYSLWEFQVFGY